MHRTIVAAFLFLFLLTFAVPVHADGCFAARVDQADVAEPEQKAFIVHHDGVEDLILSVKFEGATGDFAWLVPVPDRPVVRPLPDGIFEDLSSMTNWRERVRYKGDMRRSSSSLSAPLTVATSVVGPYEVSILSGGNDEAWTEWLDRHEYQLPPGGQGMLRDYARRDWSLVAMRIAPGRGTLATADRLATGTIAPLWFQFAADAPVFPLRISRLNRSQADILIYVLADDAFVVDPPHDPGWNLEVFPSGWTSSHSRALNDVRGGTTNDPAMASALLDLVERTQLNGRRGVLTKMRAIVPASMMEDLELVPMDVARGIASTDTTLRIQTLALAARRGTDPQSILDFLQEHLELPPTSTWSLDAVAAVHYLGAFDSAPGVRVLMDLWQHPDPAVAAAATGALARCAPGFMDARRAAEQLRDEQRFRPRIPADGRSPLMMALLDLDRKGITTASWKTVQGNAWYAMARTEYAQVMAERADHLVARMEEPVREGQRTSSAWSLGMPRLAMVRVAPLAPSPPLVIEPSYVSDPSLRPELDQQLIRVHAAMYEDAEVGVRAAALARLASGAPEGLPMPRLVAALAEVTVDSFTRSLVAGALARDGHVEALLAGWRTTRPDDRMLRGDIAWSLAYTADPAVVPTLVSYIQDSMGERPLSFEWQGWYRWAVERVPGLAEAVLQAPGITERWCQLAREQLDSPG